MSTPVPNRHSSPSLGVCYYPEHWSRDRWPDDAAAMARMGIRHVRIAEFAWSRIEPARDRFDWQWLDEAIASLAAAGLAVVMCTPTATPPHWLIKEKPDILPWDVQRQVRGFGGRRHYCYSSESYRLESERITRVLATRYGTHPAVEGWQTDNEHGNHDTVLSYSPDSARRFRGWLERRYGTVARLNEAWGNVVWSQIYDSFDDIDLPGAQVGRPNMSHWLAFRRFSSDQVVEFDRAQANILRELSPGRFVTHNFVGGIWDFDHFALARHLDFPCVNNYPVLATARRQNLTVEERARFHRTGHPDAGALDFDLTRAQGNDRWWVMEAMAGPADAGVSNPLPAAGMVRLWTWEAFAHGAEVVSFFRWRQAPFGTEQGWHGLHRPDGALSRGGRQVAQVAAELQALGTLPETAPAPVAMVVDYDAHSMLAVQPLGARISYSGWVQLWYRAARSLGLDIDFVRAGDPLQGRKLVLVPTLPHASAQTLAALEAAGTPVLLGPRSGSKTLEYRIPEGLPPGPFRPHLGLAVAAVDGYEEVSSETLLWNGRPYEVRRWREDIEAGVEPVASFTDGIGGAWVCGAWHYFGFEPPEPFLADYIEAVAASCALPVRRLAPSVRTRRRGNMNFAFNYADVAQPTPAPEGVTFLLGGAQLEPRGLAVWRE